MTNTPPGEFTGGASAGGTDVAQAVAEMIEEIGRISHSRAFSSGLNPAQWAALRFLANANSSARTATAFARAHRVTIGTATQTISALVRKGYVDRNPSPEDRRTVYLVATEAGLVLLRGEDPLRVMVEAIDGLAERPKRELIEGLEALNRALLDLPR